MSWSEVTLSILLVAGTASAFNLKSRHAQVYRQKAASMLCPPGKLWVNGTQQRCVCIKELVEHRIISCDEHSQTSKLLLGYCMTFNYSSNTTLVGPCPYYIHTQSVSDGVYALPENAVELNSYICGPLDREGLLCGHCKKGMGVSVSSYVFQCLRCKNASFFFVLYVFLQCVLVLVLFLLATSFKISATHPPLLAFAFYAHAVTTAIESNNLLHFKVDTFNNQVTTLFLKASLALYGIWSLTFFEFIFPSLCISHGLKNIHNTLFGYLPALLASICILTTFIAIKLHNRNCCLVVWLWKPFRVCYARFQRQWGHSNSLANALATFWLLCYSRIAATSFEIIHPGRVYRMTPTHYKGHFLTVAHDPTIRYLSLEHVPYATLATVMLVVVVILPPALLFLYPTQAFRRSLSRCGQWTRLHVFMETFQGCYKDGTNGTRDCRAMSAFYFILRVQHGFVYVFTGNVTSSSGFYFYMVQATVLLMAITVFAIVRPYKDTKMNAIDILLLSLLILLCLLMMALTQSTTNTDTLMSVVFVLYSIPQVVFTVWAMYALVCRTRLLSLFQSLLPCVRRRNESGLSRSSSVSGFPDRLVNPGEYEPLLIMNNNSI